MTAHTAGRRRRALDPAAAAVPITGAVFRLPGRPAGGPLHRPGARRRARRAAWPQRRA
jgi:hypothetical protein